ncbi:MAG: PIN domain-containing protein [Candidatus Competibacteraceae bacterium]
MKGYLLDTNVILELLKKRPAVQVINRFRAVQAEQLFTSSICVMELRYGAARHPLGKQLWKRIVDEVLVRLRVLQLGWEEADMAGQLLTKLEKSGTPIGVEDILIGATALARKLTVVTRNTKHFLYIQSLEVENW